MYTKQLGDSLLASYRTKIAHDVTAQDAALELIGRTLKSLKPLVSELTTANKELDDLECAAIAFQKSWADRERTIQHLTHPPDPAAMNSGHVRIQRLSTNTEPHGLLDAAKGEATLFLRGFGIGRLARFRYFRNAVKKQWPIFKTSVSKEYRSV